MMLPILLALLLAEPARVAKAREASEPQIRKLFAGLDYPPRRVLLRAFKEDRALELWAGGKSGALKLVRTYPICASSGGLGEKTREGDGQVPEGFYEVSALNPASQFLLSLRVSYPNARDRALHHTGGDIFIHGSCVTIGCIPIEDGPLQELYVIAADARAAGARLLVEIFPGRNWDGLLKKADGRPALRAFWENLREGDAIFLERGEPPGVSVDKRGRYAFR
jgi:murein L,D-transpeptidase YafK